MTELSASFSRKSFLQVHLILYGISREIFYKFLNGVIIHKPSFRFKNNFRFYNILRTLGFIRREIGRINPSGE